MADSIVQLKPVSQKPDVEFDFANPSLVKVKQIYQELVSHVKEQRFINLHK